MTANPLCSIILVSYNNFRGNTGPCLESLRQDPAPMEIIVVDNNSDEETQTLLSQAAGEDSRIRLLFNPENRGYAGGNNDGAALATSDIIILLNNDTVVPPGAMPRLATLLQEHPHWHMLGPVTNNSGNEQRIFTSGTTAKEILAQGARWCAEGKGFVYPTDLLGFFCVAIRRQVYQQMKGLDEAYGLGFYEDTDFCYRAHQAGLTLMVTEDVFIFHQRSATFSAFPRKPKGSSRPTAGFFSKNTVQHREARMSGTGISRSCSAIGKPSPGERTWRDFATGQGTGCRSLKNCAPTAP